LLKTAPIAVKMLEKGIGISCVDYYLGNPQVLLERKTKLREIAARRKEVN
jgi:hypothetical protein